MSNNQLFTLDFVQTALNGKYKEKIFVVIKNDQCISIHTSAKSS
jgi:hypothetical protein